MGCFAPRLVLEDRIPFMQQLSTARAAGRMLCTNPSDTFNGITFSTHQSLFPCCFPPYFHPPRFTSHLPASKTHPVSVSKWLRKGNSTKVTQTSRRQNMQLPRARLGRTVQQQKQSSQQQHHGRNVGSKMFQEAGAAPGCPAQGQASGGYSEKDNYIRT